MSIKVPTTYIIKTARCSLRYPSREDIPHIWSATRFEGFNDGMRWDPPGSIEELEQPLIENQKNWDNGTNFSWTIIQSSNDEFIGRIAIRQEGAPQENTWSIGYWTHPNKQKQGYATEAARAIVEFGFEYLKARRIVAAHAKWNEHSGRVLQEIGMLQTGETDKGFLKNGDWVSEYEYVISQERYLSLQA